MGIVLNRVLRVSGIALLTFGLATVTPPVHAATQAVTQVIGSETCAAGKTVRISAQTLSSGYVQIYFYWPSSASSPKYAANTMTIVVTDTGLRSTSWKVTSENLGPVSDYCA